MEGPTAVTATRVNPGVKARPSKDHAATQKVVARASHLAAADRLAVMAMVGVAMVVRHGVMSVMVMVAHLGVAMVVRHGVMSVMSVMVAHLGVVMVVRLAVTVKAIPVGGRVAMVGRHVAMIVMGTVAAVVMASGAVVPADCDQMAGKHPQKQVREAGEAWPAVAQHA